MVCILTDVKPRRARKRAKDRPSKVAGSLSADLPDTSRASVSQPWMSAVPSFGVAAPADRKGGMATFQQQRRGDLGGAPTAGKSAFRPFLTLRNRRSYIHVQMAWQVN